MPSDSPNDLNDANSIDDDNELARILASVPEFVKKLFRILEKDTYKDIVHWSESGESFVVIDQSEFSNFVLPRHFKHKNFATFIRQLNKYGFRKVKSRYESKKSGDLVWEFEHQYFQSKSPNMLDKIKRKPIGRTRNNLSNPLALSSAQSSKSFKLNKPANASSTTKATSTATSTASNALNSSYDSSQELRSQVQNLIYENSQVVSYLRQLSEHYKYITSEVGNLKKSIQDQEKLINKFLGGNIEATKDNNNLKLANHDTKSLNSSPNFDEPNFTASSSAINANKQNLNNYQLYQQSDSNLPKPQYDQTAIDNLGSPLSSGDENNLNNNSPLIYSDLFKNNLKNTNSEPSKDLNLVHGGKNKNYPTLDPYKYSELSHLSSFQPNNYSLNPQGNFNSQNSDTFSAVVRKPKRIRTDNIANYENLSTILASSIQNTPILDSNSKSSSKSIDFFKNKKRSLNKKNPLLSISWTAPPKVLIVEDIDVDRAIASKLLDIFGCSIHLAIDGSAAVTLMNEHRYDIVLMDIFMPNLDGVTATSFIRSFDNDTPIISVTSTADVKSCTKYFKKGMNEVLEKPLTKERVFTLLNTYCSHLLLSKSSLGIAMISNQDNDSQNINANLRNTPNFKEINNENSENKSSPALEITADALYAKNKFYTSNTSELANKQNKGFPSQADNSNSLVYQKTILPSNQIQNFQQKSTNQNNTFFFDVNNNNNDNYLKLNSQNGSGFPLIKPPSKSISYINKNSNISNNAFSPLNNENPDNKEYLMGSKNFDTSSVNFSYFNSSYREKLDFENSKGFNENKKIAPSFEDKSAALNSTSKFSSSIEKNNAMRGVSPGFLQMPNYSSTAVNAIGCKDFNSEKPLSQNPMLNLSNSSAFGSLDKAQDNLLLNPSISSQGAKKINVTNTNVYNNPNQHELKKNLESSQLIDLSQPENMNSNPGLKKYQEPSTNNSFHFFENQATYVGNGPDPARFSMTEFNSKNQVVNRNLDFSGNSNVEYYSMGVPQNQNDIQ
ncbi:Transcription factor SKN7 [Smittium culicis]|uniref:Transcription factor SKN7 n=1 Tax=Smittium culicis TaxID=133412 RepID=A0A1R1Y156_9FUNG|nr:Transcription factor SKN7 [Smittium culicis]